MKTGHLRHGSGIRMPEVLALLAPATTLHSIMEQEEIFALSNVKQVAASRLDFVIWLFLSKRFFFCM